MIVCNMRIATFPPAVNQSKLFNVEKLSHKHKQYVTGSKGY